MSRIKEIPDYKIPKESVVEFEYLTGALSSYALDFLEELKAPGEVKYVNGSFDRLTNVYNKMKKIVEEDLGICSSDYDENYYFKNLLSPREQQIAVGIAKGYSNNEIAEEYFISLSTVKTHIKNIFDILSAVGYDRKRYSIFTYVSEHLEHLIRDSKL